MADVFKPVVTDVIGVPTAEDRRLERAFADIRARLADDSIPAFYRSFGARMLSTLSDPKVPAPERELRAIRILETMEGPFEDHGSGRVLDLYVIEGRRPPRRGALPAPDDTPWAAPRTRRKRP